MSDQKTIEDDIGSRFLEDESEDEIRPPTISSSDSESFNSAPSRGGAAAADGLKALSWRIA